MIKSINTSRRNFIFDTGMKTFTVTFDSILESESWKNDKVIVVSYKDHLLRDCATSFARSSFLDNISHHLPEHRAKPEDYDQDVLVYKLYRLLDGEHVEDVEAEIDNVYQQRLALEDRKNEYKEEVNTKIVDFMKKKKAVFARQEVLNELSRFTADILESVRVITRYEEDGALLTPREDLVRRDGLNDIWDMFTKANSEILALDIQIRDLSGLRDFNRETLDADRASLEVTKDEEKKDHYEKAIERSGRMINKYTDEIEMFTAQADSIRERRKDIMGSVVEKLKEIAVNAQKDFEELKKSLDTMPDYPDLGDAPDDIPEMGFVVSEEMQKMIAVAKDESFTEVDLKNMTPELAESAMRSTISKAKN